MIIYSMTATFGKLSHETLTLKPGLNVIEAPNEWGKSTWCAFLVNMLYGMDTSARTTKNTLADKERYAPWSGAPMTGRIDLNWHGKNITIERRTRGRLLMGEFSAYETDTGLEVKELNSENCGPMLLGVERSVFTRAGFLKLTDLPVTQDDALRRRLNNLVTTGDESGAGDKLQQALKDLKNKCRYNRSGLLPQAEAQRDLLEKQLNELADLTEQSQLLRQEQTVLEQRISDLENHWNALNYAAAQADAEKVQQATAVQEAAQKEVNDLSKFDALPAVCDCDTAIEQGQLLQQRLFDLQNTAQDLPPLPQEPEVKSHYQFVDNIIVRAKKDYTDYCKLTKKRKLRRVLVWITLLADLLACAGGVAAWYFRLCKNPLYYGILGGGIVLSFVLALVINGVQKKRQAAAMEELCRRHNDLAPDQWIADAARYVDARNQFQATLAQVMQQRAHWDSRNEKLQEEISGYTDGAPLADTLSSWRQKRNDRTALDDARRKLITAQEHLNTLKSIARVAAAPQRPDQLTYTEAETQELLANAQFDLRQLQLKLGQYQGRCESLGQETVLRSQLKAVHRRINQLEDIYSALEHAQRALSAATAELQRKFAPRISKRAQELFQKLTGGRYDRLTLSEDLSLNTSTRDEDTLRNAQWRSDGTADQLYLALRLAVAEELTPEAPLVLDDALVRFDETRLAAAMDILAETADHKQVILFTCQKREKLALEDRA